MIISRYRPAAGGEVTNAAPETKLHVGDLIMAVGTQSQLDQFRLVIGSVSAENLMKAPGSITYRRVVLTNKRMLGKTVRELGLDHLHNVTVTRVSRGDLIFTALPDLRLQFGDMLQLVGDDEHSTMQPRLSAMRCSYFKRPNSPPSSRASCSACYWGSILSRLQACLRQCVLDLLADLW